MSFNRQKVRRKYFIKEEFLKGKKAGRKKFMGTRQEKHENMQESGGNGTGRGGRIGRYWNLKSEYT